MTRPDLDAIRDRNLVDWTGNGKWELSGDVAALLAYIADLEERCRAYEAMQHAIKRAIDTWKQEEVPDET